MPNARQLQNEQRRLYKERCAQIRRVLMDAWDPIGISGIPEMRDEYDNYIPQIYGLLRLRKPVKEIAEYLISVETDFMGLSGDIGGAMQAAARLLELDLS